MLRFEHAIKSPQTRKKYAWSLQKFVEFAKIKDADSMLQLKESFIQELIEDYVIYLKDRISPNTFPSRFAAIELFFAMNDKILNWKKLKKMYPGKVKKTGGDAYTTEHVQTMLAVAKTLRLQAMILIMASTGCRVGAFAGLKVKHIVDIENCKAIKLYEGTNEEYWGFLTPEATGALNAYFDKRKHDGEMMTGDSPVFRRVYRIGSAKAMFTSEKSLMMQVYKLIKKAGIVREKQGNRYNIQMDHGFRKRFDTIIKDSPYGNLSLKEKLMGHATKTVPLDTVYHTPNISRLFGEFKLHVAELTINNEERERKAKEDALQQVDSLQQDKSMMRDMRAEIEKINFELERMKDEARRLRDRNNPM